MMAEDIVTRAEYNYLKEDITEIKTDIKEIKVDIKETTKENTREMMGMRDFKIRTEIKLESIIESQRRSDEVQSSMLISLKEIKDKPLVEWSKIALAWKIGIGMAIIGLVIPYVLGNFMTFAKMFK